MAASSVTPVVIRFGRLGDTILLQPLLRKLRQRFGRPCCVLALGDWPATLFSAQPEVGELIPLRSQYGSLLFSPGRWRAALTLRKFRHSPIYVCEPEPRAGTKVRPMLALAGVPLAHCEFIQPMTMRENEHWIDWLLRFGDQTPPAFRASHAASASEERLGEAPAALSPRLQATAAECHDRDEWLRTQGMLGRPLVLLQAANKRTMRWNGVRHADDDEKSWPAERWGGLVRAISHRLPDAQILFCGAPAEAGYIESLLEATGTRSPRVAAAILPLGRFKALLEMAHSMVSVDTGPAHLAAAMGCPLVVLFGGRFASMWAPRSGCGSAVSAIGGLPQTRRVDEIDTATVAAAWHALPARAAPTVVDGTHAPP